MDKVYVRKYNETHIFVTGSDRGIEYELSEHFTFLVPNYHFIKKKNIRMSNWDGKIKLYHLKTNLLYTGLLGHVIDFCKKRNYEIEIDGTIFPKTQITTEQAIDFIKSLNLPDFLELRDYQIESFRDAVHFGRRTILSPTGSGKSFIIYLLCRYYDMKTLLIVPNKNLIHQMAGDFQTYGYENDIHKIYGGQDKNSKSKINVSTWQSIFRMPRDWFHQFDVVIVDETHGAKAQALKNTLEKMSTTKYRFGTTGTLDGQKSNKWIIEGLLGPVRRVTKTSDLIEEKVLSNFEIKSLVLSYPSDVCQKKWDYQKEIDFLCGHEPRNRFITELVCKTPGNNLVLYNFISKHGDILEKMFREKTDRPVYYIHGGVDAEERDQLRHIIEEHDNAIILASTKTFSTGTNIKRLNNIFFTAPSKARIQTLQAIGRVLRKSDMKEKAILFDIADNLTSGKSYNHTLRHFFERLKIYKSEQFPFKVYNLKVGRHGNSNGTTG